MQKEEAIREWAIQVAAELYRSNGLSVSVEVILEDAQKLVDFVTKDISKPYMS